MTTPETVYHTRPETWAVLNPESREFFPAPRSATIRAALDGTSVATSVILDGTGRVFFLPDPTVPFRGRFAIDSNPHVIGHYTSGGYGTDSITLYPWQESAPPAVVVFSGAPVS